MAYIIENANILKDKRIEKTSLLIKNERIASLKPTFKRFSYMKMNANSFIMTPPHIVLDTQIPFDKSFQVTKEYYIQQFIQRGCTAFLTYASVEHEHALSVELKRQKVNLLNSPIDYVIGVKIPLRLLTTTFLRKCKKEKVPVIFVEVENVDELYCIPWGWLREAMFPYNSPIVPVFNYAKERERKHARQIWEQVMLNEKIPSMKNEMEERVPLTYSTLCKIGILPLKSHIHQGAELSYNFYEKNREIRNIDEKELFLYHSHRLEITVHKGAVIRAGENVLYRPGFGEHVIINTPSFFVNKED